MSAGIYSILFVSYIMKHMRHKMNCKW